MTSKGVPNTGDLFTSLDADIETQPPFIGGIMFDENDDDLVMSLIGQGVVGAIDDIGRSKQNEELHNVSLPMHQFAFHSNVNGATNGTSQQNTSPNGTKRKRGVNKNNFALNGPEKIDFNKLGQAEGPDTIVARYHRLIGVLARCPSKFPINERCWKNFSEAQKEDAWKDVKEGIDWSYSDTLSKYNQIRKVVRAKLNERWKSFKSKLRRRWYNPFRGMDERFTCGDGRVNQEQWRLLVEWWDGKGQKHSSVNKINRKQKKLCHRTGTTTFAQIRRAWSITHGGAEVDRWTLFKLTYNKSKRHNPSVENEELVTTNEEVQKTIEAFDKLEKRELDVGREVTSEVRNELFGELFGPERRNSVRGYGIGVEWDDVPGILTEQRGISRQVAALQNAVEEQREAADNARAEMERMKKEVANKEEALRAENEARELRMKKKLETIEAHVTGCGALQFGQILAAAGVESVKGIDFSLFISLIKQAARPQSEGSIRLGSTVEPMSKEGCYLPEMTSDVHTN